MNLTTEDIDTLMEALDALKSQEVIGELLITTITAGLVPPHERQAALDRADVKLEKIKQNEKVLAEKIVLLKAKLIHMRDKTMIEEIDI